MTTTKKTLATKKSKTTTSTSSKPVNKIIMEPENLPSNPFAFEVLSLVSKQRSNAKKVDLLKKYEDPSLKAIFIWNFDESVISLLPEGDVPFEANDAPKGTEHTVLRREYKKLYRFIKGGDEKLVGFKRENLFIQLLEGLHTDEADVIISAKDKTLHQSFKGLSAAVVKEAFNWNDQFARSET